MNWLGDQIEFLNVVTGVAEFGLNWLLQSTLLITIGLLVGRLLHQRGSSVQSVIYRTSLVAVLACPIATWGLSQAGVPFWAFELGANWTPQRINDGLAEVTELTSAPAMSDSGFTSTIPPDEFALSNDVEYAELPVFIEPLPEARDPKQATDGSAVAADSLVEEAIDSLPAGRSTGILSSVISAAVVVWFCVSFTLTTRIATAWLRLSRLRRHVVRADADTIRICAECASRLDVTVPEVQCSPYVSSPCLSGLWRPVILLPEFDDGVSIREMLIHELAHLKRRDVHWNLLRQIALAVSFYQPLLWKLSRRIETTAEEVCDDYVVELGGDRQAYALQLADIAELSASPVAAACVGSVSVRSILRKRVNRIMDRSRTLSTRVSNLLLVVVITSGLVVLTSISMLGLGFRNPQVVASDVTPPSAEGSSAAQRDSDRTLAWRRTETYLPPDFEAFFPDDEAGGRRLDALYDSANRDARSDEEILRTVRQGLRHTRQDRSLVIAWIGRRFISGKASQNPDAIEIMYHAADFSGPRADPYRTRNYAVYCGLSVVDPKTPAILRTLVDLCMRVDDHNDIHRVATASKSQRAELLALLRPHIESTNEVTRKKALALERIFKGEVDAFAWAQAQRQAARAGLTQTVAKPATEIKQKADKPAYAWQSTEPYSPPDFESFFPDDEAGGRRLDALFDAADRDSRSAKEILRIVRRGLRRTRRNRSLVIAWIGGLHISGTESLNPDAIEIMYHAADFSGPNADPHGTRSYAVYYGLARVKKKTPAILRTLVDLSLRVDNPNDLSTIAWNTKSQRAELLAELVPHLKSANEKTRGKAQNLKRIFKGELDAFAWAKEQARQRTAGATYASSFRDLHAELGRYYPNFELKRIDWDAVGKEFFPLADKLQTDEEFGLLCLRLVARLEDSHAGVANAAGKLPNIEFPRWDPGFACLIDDRGRPVVYYVDQGSPADVGGFRVGMTVLSVDGRPAKDAMTDTMRDVSEYVGWSSDRYLHYQAARWFCRRIQQGERVTYKIEDVDGKTTTIEVPATLDVRYLPRLPVPIDGIADSKNVSWTTLDDNIGYIYVRRIRSDLNSSLDKAVGELGRTRGLIVDVRGNSGGGFDAQSAFRNFSSDDDAGTERPRYQGAIALLIDARCISAGEGWASWFVANKRARLFGETTAGASSRKKTYTTTNGLFKIRYSIKAYKGSLDRPIERRGLEPDVPLRQNAVDLAAGTDTVLEAARQYLVQLKSPPSD